MAPEQIAAPQQVDARTDVWALGATLFQLLTGKMPFQHEGVTTVHAVIHAVLHRPPLRPCSLRPELPPELEAVLLRCLEKEPAARFQSMTALSDALAPFRSGGNVAASAPEVAAVPAAPAAQRGKRVIGTAGAVLVGVMLGSAAFGWWHRAAAPSEPSADHAAAPAASASAMTLPADLPDLQGAPVPAGDLPDLQRETRAASDHAVSTSPDASAVVRTVERPAGASSPHLPQPNRAVSPTVDASAPPTTTRPKELYGERK